MTRNNWVDDRWPVSVKGVLGWDDAVVVLRNDRGEWELPGGRLEATDASPDAALRREMKEELGLDVDVGRLVDSWIYDVDGKRVVILTYACDADPPDRLGHSHEHTEVALLTVEALRADPMPDGYLQSIQTALRDRRDQQHGG